MGHSAPVTTTQHCHYRVKAATDNTYTNGCRPTPIKLDLQKQKSNSLLTHGLTCKARQHPFLTKVIWCKNTKK